MMTRLKNKYGKYINRIETAKYLGYIGIDDTSDEIQSFKSSNDEGVIWNIMDCKGIVFTFCETVYNE